VCAFPIIMGVVHLPRQELYWQQAHPLLHVTQMPEIMSLIQFEHIRRLLIQKKKKFRRVSQGMTNYTSQDFRICYLRECNLSTDQIQKYQLMKQ